MFLVVPALLAIALAVAQGGSIRHLASLPIRDAWTILVSFAIQAVLYISVLRGSAFVRLAGPAIYVAILCLVVVGVSRNWHLGIGARLVLIGLVLNTAVIIANAGQMPVDATALRSVQRSAMVSDITHGQYYNRQLTTASSRLTLFSDRLPVKLPFAPGYVYSIGDILVAAGAAMLAYKGARRPSRASAVKRGDAARQLCSAVA
jgi:hypothetical protein